VTAQIVILNKLCAAVASDSSVTLATSEGPKRAFPTAEKILPLPGPHKVAVLHSGCGELLGVPYYVLLGEWMRTLPGSPLGSVADYSTHLLDWISGQTALFTDEVQESYLDWILTDYFMSVRGNILQRCEEAGIDKDAWGSTEAAAIVNEVISSALDQLANRPKLPGWEEVDCHGLLRSHEATFQKVRDWVFDDTPRTEEGDQGLEELGGNILLAYEPYQSDATLVFVGFGEAELFPASESLVCQGMIASRFRSGPSQRSAVTLDMASSIMPFGQTEAINTFLRAYNLEFLSTAHVRLERVVDEIKELVNPGAGLRSQLDQISTGAHDDLETDFDALSWKSFVQPMVDTVSALPSADVARMAESLVGLQVLRQLTQAEAETVGGPIDVAVITRNHGLRWVRHKNLGVGPADPRDMVAVA
jgi:hypothetical protein